MPINKRGIALDAGMLSMMIRRDAISDKKYNSLVTGSFVATTNASRHDSIKRLFMIFGRGPYTRG